MESGLRQNNRTMQPERIALTIAFLATVAFIGGCTTTPPPIQPDPDIEVPDQWTSKIPESDPQTAWLNDFNDPELNQLVAEALAHNADLKTATARFAQTLAETGLTRADQRPSANLGLDANRQKINSIGPQAINSTYFNNYQLGLAVSWEIDLWGKLRDQGSAALAQTEAGAAELLQIKQSLAAQTVKNWFEYTTAYAQLQLAKDTADTYQKNQQAMETRFHSGLTPALDLHRIRTQTALSIAQIETAQRRLDVVARSLETLLGRYPSATISPNNSLNELPSAIPAGLPADLLQRRPDLIAAERRLSAAEKNFSATKKSRLPAISLTGTGGTRSGEFNELLDTDFSIWSLAGNLAQPIYQGGRIKANIERSAALRDQAEAVYRQTALRAFQEVETTLAAESYLQKEYQLQRLAAEQAKAAENLAWKRYRDGTTPFTDALESQRTANTVETNLIVLRNQLLQNRIDLYLALGGPFQNSL
ncbi:MAG: efflux transporter outer membrane subunit [Coraliomargaritaceae bacterium]